MISSTAVDLPDHRRQAIDACLRAGVFPIAMEHLPAADADAIAESLRMVTEADIYIGIYGQRYGTIPNGHEISITEMEFNRAIERGLPILVFTMHKEHPITIDMVQVETEAKEKLAKLKGMASEGRIRAEFKSPVDLRGQIVEALGALQKRTSAEAGVKPMPIFHPPNNIPRAPKPFVAHPYVLLQTENVIGRRDELKLLTDWMAKSEQVPKETRIFIVVSIGGMGKSALTWKWFEDVAPTELPNLAGRMWWSFYETDAHWDNFIIRALAYIAGTPESEVRQLPPPERVDKLLHLLNEQPFLLVLDGLERILLAYARMDAAHLPDDDLDLQTANAIADVGRPPNEVRETYVEKHRLRQCADLRAGDFLRRLTRVHASRVLLSTRLYPADLETQTAQPMPGCHTLFLRGLTDDDALALWRGFIGGEHSGTSGHLLPLFQAFGNYPLLLRALAGEVAQYRPAPGDFGRWRKDHPNFNPAILPLKNDRNAHVLQFALSGLGNTQRRVLHTLAAFRMPAAWETLRALLAGESGPCASDGVLDTVLIELEDRGLVGWDKKANRYDLHPIVRAVVWGTVDDDSRQEIYRALYVHFEAVPKIDWKEINHTEELMPAVELYATLVGLRRYDDAYTVWRERLDYATLWRLNLSRERTEMIALLFPDGPGSLPRLSKAAHQSYALNALATGYDGVGRPGASVPLYELAANIDERENNLPGYCDCLNDLSSACNLSGRLHSAEATARQALLVARKIRDAIKECWALARLNVFLRSRGEFVLSEAAIRRAVLISRTVNQEDDKGHFEGITSASLAELALVKGDTKAARTLSDAAWTLAFVERLEADFVRAARIQGSAEIASRDGGELDWGAERLHHALARGRAINLVEEELPALTALAELHRRRKEYETAREMLAQVWTPAECGPYPLRNADAHNVLAQLERDLRNTTAAIDAAMTAYRLAWCDGPPYAYHHGLTNARRHLHELGEAEPRLPPFDEVNFPPIPKVDLNPEDEFHVDEF